MIVTLTQQERDKFIAWLRQDANSNRSLIQQMQSMPGTKPIADQLKQRTAACLIVAQILDGIQEQTIG